MREATTPKRSSREIVYTCKCLDLYIFFLECHSNLIYSLQISVFLGSVSFFFFLVFALLKSRPINATSFHAMFRSRCMLRPLHAQFETRYIHRSPDSTPCQDTVHASFSDPTCSSLFWYMFDKFGSQMHVLLMGVAISLHAHVDHTHANIHKYCTGTNTSIDVLLYAC